MRWQSKCLGGEKNECGGARGVRGGRRKIEDEVEPKEGGPGCTVESGHLLSAGAQRCSRRSAPLNTAEVPLFSQEAAV